LFPVEITLLGKAVNTDDFIHVYDSSGQITQYELNDYAKAEGFKDWTDFQKNNKFSANFINGTQNRLVYSIKPVTEQVEQPGEQLNLFEDTSSIISALKKNNIIDKNCK
jgi:hypothetical protein